MSVVNDRSSAQVLSDTAPGRSVLEGAFFLLDAVATFSGGAGLSELARSAELPKATTYRLLEQLVELGVVQRRGRRYFVGRVLARLGQAWQPYPHLRQAAREPLDTLAALSATTVGVWAWHDGNARAVVSSRDVSTDAPTGTEVRGESLPQHAAAEVLFSGMPPAEQAPGRGHRGDGVILRRREAVVRMCCVAAPVRNADGHTIAAISALTTNESVPPRLVDLTKRAAHAISRNMTVG